MEVLTPSCLAGGILPTDQLLAGQSSSLAVIQTGD